VASETGAHSERVSALRELRTVKGRREQGRFAFEGATLLDEAVRCGTVVDELYVLDSRYEQARVAHDLEARGTAVYLVDERTAARISDLDTPTGLVAVTAIRPRSLAALFADEGLVLVLADLNDPGNAGTLLRSAEAFGANGVVFGSLGVDPYHPKVVRGAMGAIFRVPFAEADPAALGEAAAAAGATVLGLATAGAPLCASVLPRRCALIVGHERRGLGPWEAICAQTLTIPMKAPTESLNAGVAGSIALYEASKSRS